jgi:Ca2+-binding RTX toxin-like protein
MATDGDDTLSGGPGDVLAGGKGNDTYFLSHPQDGESPNAQVIENPDEGDDTVHAESRHYTLPANVENLFLHGVQDGHGNELANRITGDSHANYIEGLDGADVLDGGANHDKLRGGRGDDTYIVDTLLDDVRDISGALGGIDLVRSSVSFTLGEFIENLVLLAGAANATGNALANNLTGNSAGNQLNGRGGADTMRGLGGNDTYIVDHAGDDVIEASSAGTDTVRSSVSYTLGANVENLVLTGAAAIDGTGTSAANHITGNSAANTLIGHGGGDTILGGTGDDRIFGGRGNDSLRGEGGTDRFYFDTALNASTNVDNLINFTPADDWILLDQDIFSGIANGVLSAAAFRLGTTALDVSDRILYDQPTGRIFYDADGVGGAAAILFATVNDGTAVTNADFYVYG